MASLQVDMPDIEKAHFHGKVKMCGEKSMSLVIKKFVNKFNTNPEAVLKWLEQN